MFEFGKAFWNAGAFLVVVGIKNGPSDRLCQVCLLFESVMPFDKWRLPVSNSDVQSQSYNHLQITGYPDLIASSRDGSCSLPAVPHMGGWQFPYKILLGFPTERTELAFVNYLHGTSLRGPFCMQRDS